MNFGIVARRAVSLGEEERWPKCVCLWWAGQVCPHLGLPAPVRFLPHHPKGFARFRGALPMFSRWLRVPSEGFVEGELTLGREKKKKNPNQQDPPSAGSRRNGRKAEPGKCRRCSGIPQESLPARSQPSPASLRALPRPLQPRGWMVREQGVRKRRALKAPGVTSMTSPTWCGQQESHPGNSSCML